MVYYSTKMRLVIFLLVIAVFPLLLYFPIFTDEVSWKWLTSRWGLDSGKILTLYPQCSEAFSIKAPIVFWPAYFVDALLYGNSAGALLIRVIGILTWLGWLAGVALLGKGLRENRWDSIVSALNLSLIGVMPFLMVLNRPEQRLLVLLTLALVMPFKAQRDLVGRFVLGVSFGFLVILFFAQHAKALFFLPLWFVILRYLNISVLSRLLLGAVLLFAAGTCFYLFSQMTICQNEFIHQSFQGMMVSPKELLENPIQGVKQLTLNTSYSFNYVSQILLRNQYGLDWLPRNYGFSLGTAAVNAAISLYLMALGGLTTLQIVFGSSKRASEKALPYSFWAALGLVLSALALSAFQTSKSFYESTLVIPLWFLASLFILNQKQKVIFAKWGGALTGVSVLLLCYRFHQPWLKSWTGESQLEGQEHSIKITEQRKKQEAVKRLSARCGFERESAMTHLVLDDMTYSSFFDSKEPYHAVYVMGWWGKMSIDGIERFLKERNSSGVMCQCRWLPEELLPRAFKDEGLCCLSSSKP